MMEPFSATATIVGLIAATLQVSQELCSLISRFRQSSAEVEQLRGEVEALTKVVTQIQTWSPLYSSSNNSGEAFNAMQVGLEILFRDIAKVRDTIEKCVAKNNRVFGKVRTRLRSFLREGEISEMATRMMHHKTTLHLAFSVVSGLTHLSNKVKSLHEVQTAFYDRIAGSATEISTQLDSIQLDIQSFGHGARELPTVFKKEQRKVTTILRGCPMHGVVALNGICSHVHQLLLPSSAEIPLPIARDLAIWFLSELHTVCVEVLEAERSRQDIVPSDPFTVQDLPLKSFESRPLSTTSSLDIVHQTTQEGWPSRRHFPKPRSRIALLDNVTVETKIPTGSLIIVVKRGLREIDEQVESRAVITTGSLLFIPSTKALLMGVAVVFGRSTDTRMKIPRRLSTFNRHPNDALIFRHLQSRDLTAVQAILASGTMSVNDRDENGNSLLWYTIYDSYDFELCRLLIQHGADPSDCNKYGDHALALLVSKFPKSTSAKIPEDLLSLIRLLTKLSCTEVYGTHQYKRRNAIQRASASLLHCLMIVQPSRSPVFELVKYFLCHGADLEARDVNGNTPLLYALYYMPQSELVAVAFALIQAGADIRAVNNHQEGCLHLLLRRLSACNNYEMGNENCRAFIGLICRLLEKCELTSSNIVGYTPLDAALSPTAWPLLCAALTENGTDVRDEILAIDDRSNIVQLEVDLQAGFAQLMARRSFLNIKDPWSSIYAIEKHCFLCDHHSETKGRAAPFDEFSSMIVDELGSSIHMVGCNHFIVGDECLCVRDEDSSWILDYHPNKMNAQALRKRSWNRHMAYLLWRDGGLRSPVEFQQWAKKGMEN